MTDVTAISSVKSFVKGTTLEALLILCLFFIVGVVPIYAQDQNLPSSNSSYSSAPTQKYSDSDSDEGDLGISPGIGIIAAIAVAASVAGGIMYVKRRNR